MEDDKRKLEELAEAVKTFSLVFGLKINEAKTNVMTLNGSGHVEPGDVEIEIVDKLKYLGSILDMDSLTSNEMKGVASDLYPIWSDRMVSLTLKIRIARSLAWSKVFYGSESLTLKKGDEDTINAFDIWLWRIVLNIRWTDMKTND